jgi:protein-L-isoaspartate(D-aspartate) O-methyltransferase
MSGADPFGFERQRAEMVERQLERRGIRDPEVLGAMRRIPRELFVSTDRQRRSYEDAALPIEQGQSISQPYMVARMVEALDVPTWRIEHANITPRVLDVGTGSGYAAAVLASMGAVVIGVEREPDLAATAEQRLHELGYPITVVVADGSEGWTAEAPYAGIIVAAAAPAVPPPLVDQLADGARLVIPVGDRYEQQLVVVQRTPDGFEERVLEPCVFVPLIGRYGFPADI